MSTFENQTIPQNRFSRIGERVKKNQGDIVIVISFVLIALISFGVGYLSAPGPQKNQMIIEAPEANILQGTAGQPADMQTGILCLLRHQAPFRATRTRPQQPQARGLLSLQNQARNIIGLGVLMPKELSPKI